MTHPATRSTTHELESTHCPAIPACLRNGARALFLATTLAAGPAWAGPDATAGTDAATVPRSPGGNATGPGGTASPAASGAGPSSASASGYAEEAADLAKEGIRQFGKREFDTARGLFQRSYELAPSSKVLLNWAIAELNAGRSLDAVRHFRAYLRASDRLPDRAQAVHDDLLPRAHARVLRVIADVPDGTAVKVDGQMYINSSVADEAIVIEPGMHRLALSDGREIGFTGEEGQVVRVVLPPAATSALAPSNSASPSGAPPDALAASATLAAPAPPPSREGSSTARTVTLVAGGAAAIITLGLGGYFSIRSRDEADETRRLVAGLGSSFCHDAPSLAPCPEAAQKSRDRDNHRELSEALFVTGGILGVATLATALFWRPLRSATQSTAVSPAFAPGYVGVNGRLSF